MSIYVLSELVIVLLKIIMHEYNIYHLYIYFFFLCLKMQIWHFKKYSVCWNKYYYKQIWVIFKGFYFIWCINRLIGLVGRVFANGPGDIGSIPGLVLPKTLKMVLDTALLNSLQYKVCIEGNLEQSRERSSTLLYTAG